MGVLGMQGFATRAAADGEWNLTARFWTGAIAVTVGDDTTVIHLDDGHITAVDQARAPAPEALTPGSTDVIITVPPDVWAAMLEDPPRAHYNDLQAAQYHHGLEIGGDELTKYQYYPALRRLLELARAERNGG